MLKIEKLGTKYVETSILYSPDSLSVNLIHFKVCIYRGRK